MGKLRWKLFTYSKENDYDNIVSKINGISEKYDTEINTYKISSVVGYTKKYRYAD